MYGGPEETRLHFHLRRKLRSRSVEPSRRPAAGRPYDKFESLRPFYHKEKEHPVEALFLCGGHILVKFELKTDSISCRVRASVPSV